MLPSRKRDAENMEKERKGRRKREKEVREKKKLSSSSGYLICRQEVLLSDCKVKIWVINKFFNLMMIR